MKRGLFTVLLLLLSGFVAAQPSYPIEWNAYTQAGYLSDVQCDVNRRGWSESEFLNYLTDQARTNLAKQVQVRVQEHATMNKQAINGRTDITYRRQTNFSTDVELKLVETRSRYNAAEGTGAAIAYIDKGAARRYYLNTIEIALNKVENALTIAQNYTNTGFKTRAQEELQLAQPELDKADDALLWLSFFDYPQAELTPLMSRSNTLEQTIKQRIADLQHAAVVYLNCKADLFGSSYPLQNELKGVIAADGCSFTTDPQKADWVINVVVTSRQSHTAAIGTMTSYFAYLDAELTIDKRITSQRIYEDALSVKGGHPRGYNEAARAGFKELKTKLGTIIRTNIKQ